MRILLVTPYIPHRDVGHGAATVTSRYFEHFAARHELSVVAFHHHPRELPLAASLSRSCAFFQSLPFELDPRRLTLARFRSLAERLPLQVSCFRSRPMIAAIRAALETHAFDLVQMDLPWMGQYRRYVDVGRSRTVLMELDVATRPLERLYRRERSPLKRLWRLRELQAMTRFETALAAEFDRVYAVSEEDRALLLSFGSRREVSLFRYGVDERLLELEPGTEGGGRVLFLGSFLHPPNVDAALLLCDEILPRVREQVPEAEVVLVGGTPPPEVQALSERPGVSVLGFVEDVAEELSRADVGVVPLRLGGGVKLKTLEMMAAGLPVVTTSVGREGISGTHGTHFWVTEDAGGLVDGIVALLRDRALRRKLSTEARALVRRDHRWSSNLSKLEEELEQLTQAG